MLFNAIEKRLAAGGISFVWTDKKKSPLFLSDQEYKYVENSGTERKFEYASGRWCAKSALTKLNADSLEVLSGERGMPVWPDGFVGSIAHSSEVWCAAVARKESCLAVGIDIEKRNRTISEEMIRKICTPREREWINSCPTRRTMFSTMIFAAKESIYKMVYPMTGVFLTFADVELEINPQHSVFFAAIRKALSPEIPSHDALPGKFVINKDYVFCYTFLESKS